MARLGPLTAQLSSPMAPQFALHPWVALLSMLGFAAALWFLAFRYAKPAPIDEALEKSSQLRIIWRQFKKNRTGFLGLYLVLILAYLALITPALAPFNPDQIDAGPKRAAGSVHRAHRHRWSSSDTAQAPDL